jgi:hypothetical protein
MWELVLHQEFVFETLAPVLETLVSEKVQLHLVALHLVEFSLVAVSGSLDALIEEFLRLLEFLQIHFREVRDLLLVVTLLCESDFAENLFLRVSTFLHDLS